ncbi:MAG: HIT family protein [Anaerolineales bacterium]|jgi:diadenosine tetraphosphate (Ap4A) HIT family hydrolase
MSFEPECVFCQIVAGGAPAEIVYQDERVTAFLDIHPATVGHTLIVPNRHSTGLRSLPDEDGAYLLLIAKKLAGAMLHSDLQCDAINLFMADGAAAGQTVFHTHLHVIPRFSSDGSSLRLHSPGKPADRPPLSETAASIRTALEAFDD